MLFVAFAILITVGIALAINADIGTLIGLTQDQTARAIPLVIMLTLLASTLVGRRHRFGEIIAGFVIWIAAGAVLFVGYTLRDEFPRLGQRLVGELQPGAAMIDPETGNVQISRSFRGGFRVETSVNGASVPMIFDTGASAVVLSAADARLAGIDTAGLRYTMPVQTANGTGYAAAVTLDLIEVGNIARKRIKAYVVQDGALDMSLLGMTFLETLSRYTVTRDALEMHD